MSLSSCVGGTECSVGEAGGERQTIELSSYRASFNIAAFSERYNWAMGLGGKDSDGHKGCCGCDRVPNVRN